MVEKFKNNDKIKVYDFGISDEDKSIEIALLNDASSFYINAENKILVKVVSFTKFLNENNIDNIDLIKINIEGDEFPVLKSLIDNDVIHMFKNIQVQFHQFIPDSVNLTNLIFSGFILCSL